FGSPQFAYYHTWWRLIRFSWCSKYSSTAARRTSDILRRVANAYPSSKSARCLLYRRVICRVGSWCFSCAMLVVLQWYGFIHLPVFDHIVMPVQVCFKWPHNGPTRVTFIREYRVKWSVSE